MLAKELVEVGYIDTVENTSVQKYWTENEKGIIFLGKEIEACETYHTHSEKTYSENFLSEYEGVKRRMKEKLNREAEKLGANYLFTSTRTSFPVWGGDYELDGGKIILEVYAFPVAMITEREVENLKDKFKGEIPKRVQKAATSLGLNIDVDYMDLYKNDPERFKRYFSKISDLKREGELKKIVLSGASNVELQEWLSTTFPELSKKIAMNIVGDKDG